MESIPNKQTPILVVDDDIDFLLSVKTPLLVAGMAEPALVSDSRRVIQLLKDHHFRLLLLDIKMPHICGLDLLQQIKEEFPAIECVMLTAVDEVASVVNAMRYGAFDYLVKPIESEKLIIAISRALERHDLKERLSLFEKKRSFAGLKNPLAFKDLVAEDEKMALVFHQAEAAALTDYNLLITGETGTGKEVLASVIHTISHRSKSPFVIVNVGASSKTLFENDFFGHTKGAYTGALTDREGFFEAAQGGTIFLDEITELDQESQVKLLRVIERKELYRLGSTEIRNVNVRIIAASNCDVETEVSKGHFRNDLFFRLNTLHITIPPLRERNKDVLLLVNHFLRVHAKKNKKEIQSVSPRVVDYLLGYHFPGNVRELENIIASAVLLEKEKVLTMSSVRDLRSAPKAPLNQDGEVLFLAEAEKRHIMKVFKMAGGNRSRAAQMLNIGRATLRRKLNSFDDQNSGSK